MLSPPEILGDSLNFKYLEQRNDNRRNEVLRRTGTAPLSIVARDLKKDSMGKRLLFSLSEREARRIRRVHTSTDRFSHFAWTKLFLHEEPNLEIVSFRQYHGTNTSLLKVFLFNNRPPKIHTFIMEGFAFFLPGPWNESLRHLEVFGSILRSLSPALACMSKLESLHLNECEIIEDVEKDITFTLPNVRQFNFQNDLKYAASILDLIPPTEGLTSNIVLNGGKVSSLPSELASRLHTGLVQHMQLSFPSELQLHMTDSRTFLANRLSLLSIVSVNHTFSIICLIIGSEASCLLLDTLSNGLTSTITHLGLSFELSIFGGYGHDALEVSIARLLASLQSVEVLHTTISDIPIFTQRLHNQPICFTRLHTLVLKPRARAISMPLVASIKKRHSVGFPLRKIEIKGSVSNVHKKALQYLRGSGLTWKFDLTVLPIEKGENRSK